MLEFNQIDKGASKQGTPKAAKEEAGINLKKAAAPKVKTLHLEVNLS